MKAIVVTRYGGPETLKLDDVDDPVPGRGEVRVRVAMAGVNFIDVYNRQGVYSRSKTYEDAPPFVLGREAVGEIDLVGEDVQQLAVGDRVGWCLHPGSYAQLATVPAWRLVKIPNGMGWGEATALMLQGGTAHYLTHSLFPLQSGHTALVHAAAGGVGRLLVQLARLRGARVIATVGTDEKADMARRLGADVTIKYREEDFAQAVLRATDGEGVDVLYDGVGQATYRGDLQAIKRRGALVLFGAASGVVSAVDPLDLAEAGSIWLTRPHMAHYMSNSEEIQSRFDDLHRWCAEGQLETRIDQTFALEDAAEAHRYLEAGRTSGKLLLEVP